jgi:hypothetical protein
VAPRSPLDPQRRPHTYSLMQRRVSSVAGYPGDSTGRMQLTKREGFGEMSSPRTERRHHLAAMPSARGPLLRARDPGDTMSAAKVQVRTP